MYDIVKGFLISKVIDPSNYLWYVLFVATPILLLNDFFWSPSSAVMDLFHTSFITLIRILTSQEEGEI